MLCCGVGAPCGCVCEAVYINRILAATLVSKQYHLEDAMTVLSPGEDFELSITLSEHIRSNPCRIASLLLPSRPEVVPSLVASMIDPK